MGETYSLVITVDRFGEKSTELMSGPLHEIDKFTTTCDSTGDLRENFPDEIDLFRNKYGNYMRELEEKNNKRETGDITILNSSKERRVRVLYKKHLFVFKAVIFDNTFLAYLKLHDPELYNKVMDIKKGVNHILSDIDLNENTSIIIRGVYKMYKDRYAKEYNKPTPDALYKCLDIPQPPDPREDPEYEESEENEPMFILHISTSKKRSIS